MMSLIRSTSELTCFDIIIYATCIRVPKNMEDLDF